MVQPPGGPLPPFVRLFETDPQVPAAIWWPMIIGVASALLVVFYKVERLPGRRARGLAAALVLLLGALLTYAGVATRAAIVRRLTSGQFESLEGPITVLTPEGPGGHPVGVIAIGDRRFTFATAMVTPFYGGEASASGVMRVGMRARVAIIDGEIARLEVEDMR